MCTAPSENTYFSFNADSALECQARCRQEAACEYWTYKLSEWKCYLKWKVESGPIVSRKTYLHGTKTCPKSIGMFLHTLFTHAC